MCLAAEHFDHALAFIAQAKVAFQRNRHPHHHRSVGSQVMAHDEARILLLDLGQLLRRQQVSAVNLGDVEH